MAQSNHARFSRPLPSWLPTALARDLPVPGLAEAARSSAVILAEAADSIAAELPADMVLCELGFSGSWLWPLVTRLLARQPALVLSHVDPSEPALVRAALAYAGRTPHLEHLPQRVDYLAARELQRVVRGPRLVVLRGDRMGQLAVEDVVSLLRAVRVAARPDDRVLLAVDVRGSAGDGPEPQELAALGGLLAQRLSRLLGVTLEARDWMVRSVWSAEHNQAELTFAPTAPIGCYSDVLGLPLAFGPEMPISMPACRRYPPAVLDALLWRGGFVRAATFGHEACALVMARPQ